MGSCSTTPPSNSCATPATGSCGCGPDCKCGPDCQCCADKSCGPTRCLFGIALAGLLAAMVMYLFEAFWHGVYMMPLYEQTKTLWRSYAEMQTLGGYNIAVIVGMGLVLSFIFSRNYEGKCMPEGIRFGFYIGLLLGISHFCAYTYMPIPLELATRWMFGWIIEGVLVGLTLSLAYGAMAKKSGKCGPKTDCCK